MKQAAHLLNLKPHHWKVASAEGLNAPPTPTSAEIKNKRRSRHPGYYEGRDKVTKLTDQPTSMPTITVTTLSTEPQRPSPINPTDYADRSALTSSGHIYTQMNAINVVPPSATNSNDLLATPTKVTLKMPQEQHDLLYSPADLGTSFILFVEALFDCCECRGTPWI